MCFQVDGVEVLHVRHTRELQDYTIMQPKLHAGFLLGLFRGMDKPYQGAMLVHDILIKNARIVDGSGNPWFSGDIAISGGRIAAVGSNLRSQATQVIDAESKVVSPGFIDIHTHSDLPVLIDPDCASYIHQGVTTQVIGNCGFSVAPVDAATRDFFAEVGWIDADEYEWTWTRLSEYLATVESRGVSTNVAALAGHGTIRTTVMRYDNRRASADELCKMRQLADEAMQDGAFGISSGLIYVPGCYAPTEELCALAEVSASHAGIYVTHIRGENDTLIEAVREAIQIGRHAGIPVQISHFKAMGKHMWGESETTLAMLDEARSEGIDVTADQYPYTASATLMGAFLPPWAYEGGKQALFSRLSDPETRERIKQQIISGHEGWVSLHKGVGWDNVIITSCPKPEYEGKTIAGIAQERNASDFDTAFDLLVELDNRCNVVYYTICEEDIERIMKHPALMIGSDSSSVAVTGPLSKGKPHPRYYGTFARVLGRYVREKKVLTLEEAVRKMTSLPAARLGLLGRGLLRPGFAADVVVFDPETIQDTATYLDPKSYAQGVEHVIVNGSIALSHGEHRKSRSGMVLRHSRT